MNRHESKEPRRPLARGFLTAVATLSLLVACGRQASRPVDPPRQLPSLPASCQPLPPEVLPPSALNVAPQALSVHAPARWDAPRVTGQVLIHATPKSASAQQLGALSAARTEPLGAELTLAYTPAGMTDQAFAASLAARGLTVQPNYRYHALDVPSDPGYLPKVGVPVRGFDGQRFVQDNLYTIDAQCAWDYLDALGVQGRVKVAVLDTGINRDHEDLKGRIEPGFDFCSTLVERNGSLVCSGEDNNPSEVTEGDIGHGTAAAGLIAANTNNGVGIAGLGWSGEGTRMLVNIVPVKVFGGVEATTAAITKGIDYAIQQGVKVINLSLGFAGQDAAIAAAIGRAKARNIVVVAAAGNNRNDGILYPASDPRVLAVGALGSDNLLACYSALPQPGQKAIDLVAPGGPAGGSGATPDVCYSTSDRDIVVAGETAYRLRAGTSVAAPQVSGVAALIFAVNPNLSATQVEEILKRSARVVRDDGVTLRVLDAGAAVQLAARTQAR